MKKYLGFVMWSVLLVGVFALLGFVNQKQATQACQAVQIRIDRSNGNFFVEEEDISAMLYHDVDTVLGRPLKAIDAEALEHKIDNHPSIANSEVFKTINGKLIIEVEQRTPILRIFSKTGDTYYIDSTGSFMPTSQKYTARVLIANGNVAQDFVHLSHLNVSQLSDSLAGASILKQLFNFAQYIRKEPFWRAQIEQLYVNKDSELELIPRVGNHRIVMGDDSMLEQKFEKLKIFYHKGLPKTGWNEYSVINLKYANQIVCTKLN